MENLSLHCHKQTWHCLRKKPPRGAGWLLAKTKYRRHYICCKASPDEVRWTEQAPLLSPHWLNEGIWHCNLSGSFWDVMDVQGNSWSWFDHYIMEWQDRFFYNGVTSTAFAISKGSKTGLSASHSPIQSVLPLHVITSCQGLKEEVYVRYQMDSSF